MVQYMADRLTEVDNITAEASERKLGTVVRADVIRDAPGDEQIRPNVHYIIRFQAIARSQAKALPRKLINHRQCSYFCTVF